MNNVTSVKKCYEGHMFHFLNKVFGIKISKVDGSAAKKLPIHIANEYEILECLVENVPCLFLSHRGDIHLSQMRKHHQIVTQTTDVQCVFVLYKSTTYQRKRLIESRVSFIVPDSQVYMPFVGVILKSANQKRLHTASTISFAAQRILITSVLENWGESTLSEIANRTGYSKMSISRYLDEIEQNFEGSLRTIRNMRVLTIRRESTLKKTYDKIHNVLKDPVLQKIPLAYLPDKISNVVAGGYTALSRISMIADNAYPTIALTKKAYQVAEIAIQKAKSQSGEEPEFLLEVWEYLIPDADKSIPDPISLAITLEKGYPDDDRTEKAIDTMLREYKW